MVLTLAALAVSVRPETELELLRGGARAGTVAMEQRLLDDGRKLSRVVFRSDPPGVEVTQESTYLPDGSPQRMLQAVVSGGRRTARTAVFDDVGALFTAEGKEPVRVPYPPSGSTAAASEFWFLRDRPILGEKVEYFRFDLAAGGWKPAAAMYVGPREVVVRGQVRKAHRTVVEGVASDVDESGVPWRVSLADGSVLERL